MGKIMSIDLACSTRGFGICLLEAAPDTPLKVEFASPEHIGLHDPLFPTTVGEAIFGFCSRQAIPIVLIDGPQAWKDPDSELAHCRHCEKKLNTPAKTGLVGSVKPATWTRFVAFSIAVFSRLVELGGKVAENPQPIAVDGELLVLESFPFSAWRKVGILALPSKRKCRSGDLVHRLGELQRLYRMTIATSPNHDELQALVAGLAGIAILDRNASGYQLDGSAPIYKGGLLTEGYIVNPLGPRTSVPRCILTPID
jgi:hypothetical protein